MKTAPRQHRIIGLALLFFLAIGVFSRPAAARDYDNAYRQLHKIMRKPVYRRWRLHRRLKPMDWPGLRWLHRSIAEMWKWLDRHAPTVGAGAAGRTGPFVQILKVAAWIALAVAILVGAWLIWRRSTGARKTAIAPAVEQRAIDEALERGDALALDQKSWMVQAARSDDDRDFRRMYRALYLALLSGLHERGHIRFNRNHTNWMYVSTYRGPREQRDNFAALTDLFDRVWYGRHLPDGESPEGLRRQVATLIAAGES